MAASHSTPACLAPRPTPCGAFVSESAVSYPSDSDPLESRVRGMDGCAVGGTGRTDSQRSLLGWRGMARRCLAIQNGRRRVPCKLRHACISQGGMYLPRFVLLVMSIPMIIGDETAAHAPKWLRDSFNPREMLCPLPPIPFRLPTSIMSCAHTGSQQDPAHTVCVACSCSHGVCPAARTGDRWIVAVLQ
jgi:hypothetical protein